MGEKTFDPTPKHQAEMRHKGQVAQSPELTGAVTLLVAVYLLGSRMGTLLGALQEIMRDAFTRMAAIDVTMATVREGGMAIASTVGRDLLNFTLVLAGVGIAVGLIQTRGLFSPQRLKPDFNRVNPFAGIKRVFSKQGLVDTAKGVFKMALLAVVLYVTVKDLPSRLAAAAGSDFRTGVALVGDTLSGMGRQAALWLLLAAGLDYVYQARQHKQQMKMSREELMEELKNAEGQPFIRAKIREAQRRWSRQRMMQQLAYADVVVTNPTHLAIALRYDAKKMPAPTVVAKGKGLIAEQIMKRAAQLHIPLMQNIPLAHALITVDLDAPIPVALYQAVAEVLAFVYRLRPAGATR